MYLSKTLIKTHKHRHRALWHCRKVCSINTRKPCYTQRTPRDATVDCSAP